MTSQTASALSGPKRTNSLSDTIISIELLRTQLLCCQRKKHTHKKLVITTNTWVCQETTKCEKLNIGWSINLQFRHLRVFRAFKWLSSHLRIHQVRMNASVDAKGQRWKALQCHGKARLLHLHRKISFTKNLSQFSVSYRTSSFFPIWILKQMKVTKLSMQKCCEDACSCKLKCHAERLNALCGHLHLY